MERRLIIDGSAVYELDEKCMLTKQLEKKEEEKRACKEVNRAKESSKYK